MRYANPWSQNGTPTEYEFDRPVSRTACGRGAIFKEFERSYHYVIDGVMVTMRAGRNRELLERMVAHIDGTPDDDWSVRRAASTYRQQAA